MNKIQIFKNDSFGAVRTVEVDGEPWLVGKDVATALGYSNTKDALAKHIDEDDKRLLQRSDFATLENHIPKEVFPVNFVRADIPNRGLTIINESGVYALVLGSKLPTAKKFKHWVTSEILPTIRKHGAYSYLSENSNAILMTITPEMAKEMLEHNIGNRKLNIGAVNRIATDMSMGKYAINGTSIKFYKDGTLADGQTRLSACVKANIPFTTYVIRGLDKATLPTIDCGRPRSLVDTLNMAGCSIQKKLVPAMNVYFSKGQKLTASQAEVIWNDYEDKFTELCEVLAGGHHDYILSQAAVRSYLIHLAVSEGWSKEDLEAFVTGLKDKPNRDNAYEMSCYNFRNFYNRKIRNKLSNTKSSGNKTKTNVTIDALCSLAESYKTGRIITRFIWMNRAGNILNIGYKLAQRRFALIETEAQKYIPMVD